MKPGDNDKVVPLRRRPTPPTAVVGTNANGAAHAPAAGTISLHIPAQQVPVHQPSALPLAVASGVSGGATVLIIQYAAHVAVHLIRSLT